MISENVLSVIMEVAILSFVVPVVFAVVWKMRTRKSIIPTLIGMLIFVMFTMGFESIPNMLFVTIDNPVSRFINNHPWVYAIYGGLIAGIFEEMGRFVAFKFLLVKHTYKESAISYGLGHGGIECMLIMGVAQLQNYMYAQLINSGQIDTVIGSLKDQNSIDSMNSLVDSIKSITLSTCIWGGVERVFAIFLQVALSILVFQAVRVEGKKMYLAIAIILHALVDVPAALYQQGKLPLVATEIFIIIFTIAVAAFAYKIYQELPTQKETTTNASNWGYASQKYSGIDQNKTDNQ